MATTKPLTARCRPFASQPVAAHRIRVEADGTVLVWDAVAGHYTRCHSLGVAACRRIRRLATK